jgi:hypothetical protein
VRVRVTRVQETARSTIQYDGANTRRPRASRTVRIDLEAAADDADARAAVAGLTILAAEGTEGQPVTPSNATVDIDTARNLQAMVVFNNLDPSWTNLPLLEGEVLAFPRARTGLVEIPLGEGPVDNYREGELHLRVKRDAVDRRAIYQVEMVAPASGMLALFDTPLGPELLNAERESLRATLRGAPLRGEDLRTLRLVFNAPAAAPAVLRLPLVVRSGEPQRFPFRLTRLPLPLGGLR